MTELVLDNGDKCIATSIEPTALSDLFPIYGKDCLRLVHTDVTQTDDVELAFSIAEQAFGHVDVVFNNAGVTVVSEVEGTPAKQAREMFEVNFWGNANVAREAVRFFREVNGPERGGKLLQMTSAAGVEGWATLGYYAASKHAVEGLTKGLMQEVKPEWNIQIMMIEPDFTRTAIFNFAEGNLLAPIPAYEGKLAEETRQAFKPEMIKNDPRKAMRLLHRVAQQEKLPRHLPLGEGAIRLFRMAATELTKAADEWETTANDLQFDD